MSVQTLLARHCELVYELARKQQEVLENQKRIVELEAERQVLEKEMEFSAGMTLVGQAIPNGRSFIERRRNELEVEDLEFLSQEFRGTTETAEHTQLSVTTLKRLAKAGKIDFKKSTSGRFSFNTVSVVKYLLDGKAD